MLRRPGRGGGGEAWGPGAAACKPAGRGEEGRQGRGTCGLGDRCPSVWGDATSDRTAKTHRHRVGREEPHSRVPGDGWTRLALPRGLGSAGGVRLPPQHRSGAPPPPAAGSSCSRARSLRGEGPARAAGGVTASGVGGWTHGLPDGQGASGMRGLSASGCPSEHWEGGCLCGGPSDRRGRAQRLRLLFTELGTNL